MPVASPDVVVASASPEDETSSHKPNPAITTMANAMIGSAGVAGVAERWGSSTWIGSSMVMGCLSVLVLGLVVMVPVMM